MSQMPVVTALIYQHCYGNGEIQPPREDLDWAANFMHMIGRPCEGVEVEALRAYLLVMADYGGSVTQHTMALVSSALSDVYLSYSASINALQGPYHNLVCNNFSTLLQNI
jgi:citrate synthase